MNLIPSLVDDQLAEIEASVPVDRLAFRASTILGAKSLAYQSGIHPRREPELKAFFGGEWTLIYGVAA